MISVFTEIPSQKTSGHSPGLVGYPGGMGMLQSNTRDEYGSSTASSSISQCAPYMRRVICAWLENRASSACRDGHPNGKKMT